MRTRSRERSCSASLVIIVLSMVLIIPAFAQDACTSHSLRGTYVVSIAGFITLASAPQFALSAYSPVAIVGTYTFDGVRQVSRSLKVNFAGQPFPVSDQGSYQVNPDCSASAHFSTNNETFALTPMGMDTLAIVSTTAGEVGAGTLIKQKIANCSSQNLRGTWVFIGNGLGTFQTPPQTVDAFFPVAVEGTWAFDGSGTVSRSLALNFAGLPGPYVDVGTYQVNADCTTSAYFPSDSEPFDLFVANSATLVYGVSAVGRTGTGLLRKQQLDQ